MGSEYLEREIMSTRSLPALPYFLFLNATQLENHINTIEF